MRKPRWRLRGTVACRPVCQRNPPCHRLSFVQSTDGSSQAILLRGTPVGGDGHHANLICRPCRPHEGGHRRFFVFGKNRPREMFDCKTASEIFRPPHPGKKWDRGSRSSPLQVYLLKTTVAPGHFFFAELGLPSFGPALTIHSSP